MASLNTQGVVFNIWDGAAYDPIGELLSFTGPGGSAAVINATHLGSIAREKKMGLPDEGQFSFEVNLDPADTDGQVAVRTARTNRTLSQFQLELTDSGPTTLTFNGYVLEFSVSGGEDDLIKASITIEITGAVTWA